jgi:peptidoglycan hydrolase CwlO-like protein
MLISDWLFVTAVIIFILFIFARKFYFKSLLQKEVLRNTEMKTTLKEAETLIRKYQLQLQRAIGNIDILTEELSRSKDEIKSMKSRNTELRVESERLRSRVNELESKIETLV